jgi:hypothetical protein
MSDEPLPGESVDPGSLLPLPCARMHEGSATAVSFVYFFCVLLDAIARTLFAANIDLSTNILQIVVQVTLTRWLLRRRGAGPVIAV